MATAADGTHPTGMHSCFRLFKPLHYTVWLICVLCVMCASISLWFIDLTSPVLQMQRKLYSKVMWISETSAKWMQDEVLYNVGSVLSQGNSILHYDLA